MLIGGDFTNFNGSVRSRVARLVDEGSIDPAFVSSLGADDIIHSTALQTNGRVLIGGRFTSYHGIPRNRIARLFSNGVLDSSFKGDR